MSNSNKILLAVAAALAVLMLAFVVSSGSCGGGGGGGGAAPASTSGATSASASADSSDLNQVLGYSFLAGVGGYKSFALAEEARLKFVDEAGVAQRFNGDSAGEGNAVIYLTRGSTVWASISTNDFEIPGREYRILERRYLESLRSDLASYRAGERSFSSALSAITSGEEYQNFIRVLASDESFEPNSAVACLVVDASCCV